MTPHPIRLAATLAVMLASALPAAAQTSDWTCHIESAPMRDGVRLATEVYLPAGPGPFPVVLTRSPYNRSAPAPGSNCDNAQLIDFAENGYAALNQDVRGRYRSEGTFDAIQQEGTDGYDAVEWAARQPWSNGKVGMFGGSYVGVTQWQPAIRTPPHLVAIAPNVTASDYHDNWTYVNGAFDLWFAQSWLLLTFAPDELQRRLEAAGLPPHKVQRQVSNWIARGREDILTDWVWQLPLPRMSAFRMLAPYYYEWLHHKEYDEYWRRVDLEPRYDDVTVPVLNTGGWYDIFQVGTVRNFQGIQAEGGSDEARSGSKLIMRASCHACPPGTFAGAIDFGEENQFDPTLTLRWFDYWLKGIDNGVDEEPAVQLFVMVPPDSGNVGDGFWVTADTYPLPDTDMRHYNLRSDGEANTRQGNGELSASLPPAGEPDRFVYDPRDPVPTKGGNMCCINDLLASGAFDQSEVELRDDVLVYTSAPLEEDTVVIGPVSVRFWASSSARDTDFTAKLVDVHPGGVAHNVLDRIVRASFREGSKWPATPITPGRPYEYTIDLGHTATVFRAGHQIRLEISSSSFPHYDRNLNKWPLVAGQGAVLQTAEQTVYHDWAHPSHLLLPVVPGVDVP